MEKRIIRWKKTMLASCIELDEQAILELRRRDLLWNSALPTIQEEPNNFERTSKFIDLMLKTTFDKKTFDNLCEFLDERYPWVSEELRVELEAERGDLQVDEFVKREVNQLVHRHYGGTKRVSEREKRKLESLLTLRTQCTKEIWKRNFDVTKRALEDQQRTGRDRDSMVSKLTSKLESYNEAHRRKILKFVPMEKVTRLTYGNERDGKEFENGKVMLLRLEKAVEEQQHLLTVALMEYENLKEEKMKALKLLKVFVPESHLDKEIESAVETLNGMVASSKVKADKEVEKAKKLDEQIKAARKEHEETIKARDNTIRVLASNLEKSQETASQMEEELGDLKRQLQAATTDLSKSKTKAKYLEKSRHLGYVFDNCYSSEKRPSLRDVELPRIDRLRDDKTVSYSADKKMNRRMSRDVGGNFFEHTTSL